MTSISQNVCIDKLEDIVNKYKKTHQTTIKMKPVDVTSKKFYDFIKEEILNLKLVILLEYENRKTSWKRLLSKFF